LSITTVRLADLKNAALRERYARPELLIAGIVGLHVLFWTLMPLLVHRNAPLDVIEGAVWGREWQLGYPKGPPLVPWMFGALDPLEDELRLAAVYFISQLCVAVTFFGVWRLGCRILSRVEALIAVMLMEGIYYFIFPTPELNEIVVQMPISALLGWSFHRAITDDGRRRDWIVVGVLAAVGMWTRYSTAVLLLSQAAFLILPDTRRHLRKSGPYLALGTFAALWSPHVLWMVQSNFQPVGYVYSRATPLGAPIDYVLAPFRFTTAQLIAVAPALLLTLVLRLSRRGGAAATDANKNRRVNDKLYIGFLALGSFIIAEALSLSLGLGLRSMWGGPLWCFLGLFLVLIARPVPSFDRLHSFAAVWCVVAALPLVAYAITHGIGPEIKANEKRSSFPGDALADALTASWRNANEGKPLRFVVGETWLAGNVAFYSSDRPSTYVR
jgi:4-amino-4-deoxy-L-arabinose transferase-like glycosyltransferase